MWNYGFCKLYIIDTKIMTNQHLIFLFLIFIQSKTVYKVLYFKVAFFNFFNKK